MCEKTLKTRFGRWLSIDELRDLFTHLPGDTVHTVPVNRKLLETASEFVEKKNGWWEHHDWNGFLETLDEQGFRTSQEFQPAIGSILEIFKTCYHRGEFSTVVEKRRQPAAPRSPRTSKKARPAAGAKSRG